MKQLRPKLNFIDFFRPKTALVLPRVKPNILFKRPRYFVYGFGVASLCIAAQQSSILMSLRDLVFQKYWLARTSLNGGKIKKVCEHILYYIRAVSRLMPDFYLTQCEPETESGQKGTKTHSPLKDSGSPRTPAHKKNVWRYLEYFLKYCILLPLSPLLISFLVASITHGCLFAWLMVVVMLFTTPIILVVFLLEVVGIRYFIHYSKEYSRNGEPEGDQETPCLN
ncbi:unnamed protein product [Moneuplotes crassus]|uniref:Uncharacterized protein n=1 Tax=Euplotes crassus TaxID=5936 RepID=A0AAD2D5D9_EUPCR|nr:unnamed protein product [Moneuplotes crassus]